MARIDYPVSSPYATTPQLDWRLGRYAHRALKPQTSDRQITVTTRYHQRPERLSGDLYGTPNYWWVFGLRNPNLIRDPFFDLKAGMTIMVPDAEYLRRVIG